MQSNTDQFLIYQTFAEWHNEKTFAFLHPNLGLDDASITFNMSRGMENSFIFVI